jgi:deoxyhypusine synthase
VLDQSNDIPIYNPSITDKDNPKEVTGVLNTIKPSNKIAIDIVEDNRNYFSKSDQYKADIVHRF